VTDRPRRRADGILGGPVDAHRRPTVYGSTPLAVGLVVEHRGSGIVGAVRSWAKGFVVIVDRAGAQHRLPHTEAGAFRIDGRSTTLVPPPPPTPTASERTASGSVAAPRVPARVARASRLLVEGIHDAELLERVWGDDLRHEGIVVEPLHGIDHLADAIAAFDPGPGRRLGVLVDHLVEGSKEARVAATITHPHVCIRGHRFIDVWAAVDPRRVGVTAWPDIPYGSPWKDGVAAAFGVTEPGAFWRRLLGGVRSYADLDPSLVGAVEELIDFVTAEA
jgi:hypothetical protein